MSIINFPGPPGDGGPPEDDLPRFTDRSVNGEQLATLEMMGLTLADVIGEHHQALFVLPEGGTEEVPSIAGPHIIDRYSPVVMHRGRRRAILPNGDILSLRTKG